MSSSSLIPSFLHSLVLSFSHSLVPSLYRHAYDLSVEFDLRSKLARIIH